LLLNHRTPGPADPDLQDFRSSSSTNSQLAKRRCIVIFEDALAGVEAGKRGQFGCVVGIDRGQQSTALRQHGADVVIESLQEVHVDEN
jgi:beta-phosphoglucomutase-like phosphatase (HAD superfamily)